MPQEAAPSSNPSPISSSAPPPQPENQLGAAASAYLRAARYQPVHWHPWGPAAFALAASQNKPILLDIGATWCHWCHVMDRESYDNPGTAALINHHFIAIKVDRDEHPEIDARYQAAIAAISGQGGWPLTAFLTPTGRPFFGGTYFPPEDRHGRPSLQRVLLTMADAFEQRRDEVEESAGSVLEAVEQSETLMGNEPAAITPALLEALVRSILAQFDTRSGGFGSQPKFPHTTALDLLLVAARSPVTLIPPDLATQAATAVRFTLEQMAAGGMHDHLAGGFHRYSVDERWIVPHFEKMSYDNSELLRAYVHGFQSFTEPRFSEVSRNSLHWFESTLTDQQNGGFYASQDADHAPDDDGDFFTWTRDEVTHLLAGPDQAPALALALAFFDINEVGDMHHNPARNVLRTPVPLATAAASAGLSVEAAAACLPGIRARLLTARTTRPQPFIDRTLYTAWNSLCVSALLEAGRILQLPETHAFALRTLDRLLASAVRPGFHVLHVAAYGETSAPPDPATVPGTLEDYATLGLACLDAWTSTTEPRFLVAVESIVGALLQRFHDPAAGGFLDMPSGQGSPALGLLAARRKPIQDAPSAAGNSSVALLLLRAGSLFERPDWVSVGRQTLEVFAGVVEHLGLYAAGFGLAAQRLLAEPLRLTIIGEGPEADALLAAASQLFLPAAEILRVTSATAASLPAGLAASTAPLLAHTTAVAQVCAGPRCLAPVATPQELSAQLRSLVASV